MFRAIGVVIILWGLASFFGEAFTALNLAAAAAFNTLEQAAAVMQAYLPHP